MSNSKKYFSFLLRIFQSRIGAMIKGRVERAREKLSKDKQKERSIERWENEGGKTRNIALP